MIDQLSVEASLADKPSFRWVLEEQEKDINDLEAILEKVSKSCKTFCETGKAFCDSMGPFTEGIHELADHFKADEDIKDAYTTFSEHLEEINSFYSMLLEQAKRSILSSMIEDMKKMLKEVKSHRKAFREKSDELDTALYSNSAKIPKKKDDTLDATSSLTALSATKVEFHHTAVDYVYEINKLQLGKQFLVTDKFLHLMYSFYSFFHQGYLTLQHIDPYLKNLNGLMQQKQSQRDESLKKLESRHKQVAELKSNDYDGLMITPKDDSVLLEGYLYKRSHNTFKTWKRRYFMIKENQLHCHKRSKGSKEENNKIISEDLRISQVKSTEEQDRRYCFELIMPTKKIFLQADSQKVKDAWIKSLQCGIEAAIHNTTAVSEVSTKKSNGIPDENMKSGNSPEILKLLSEIKNMPGNEVCADCANKEPVWASINLGVTLCIMCSGIHRNLGVHISKVRSIELDIWEHEQCLLMLQLGNAKVNAIFEHSIVDPYRKPGISSNIVENELWIRAKYDEKLFLENRDYVKVRLKKRHQSVAASYKASSISYDPATITSHHSSLKGRTKREVAMRPLSKIFQNINRSKKRGGSDGAAYIDTDQDNDEEGRALSPQYALLGTEEPNSEGTTHTETCVPDNLLSNATLSSSSPDILADTTKSADGATESDSLNLNLIGPLALNNSLFVCSKVGDVDAMFKYICEGADINFRNSTSGDSTPLIQAVHSNSREAVQLLLIHGADVNQIDEKRQTALHHATILGYTDLACMLLKKGADHRRVNTDNKDALDIAVSEERASLVTVLRFIRINDASDPTSQQLLTEFSRRPDVENKR